MKPLLSYYGGKQRMAPNIIPLIPHHTVYVEPFAGGLAILFMKPTPIVTNTDNYREVVNDLDGRIINFYRVMQDKRKAVELKRMIKYTLYSKAEHTKSNDLIKSGEGSDVLQAWALYVNLNCSFANVIGKGWGFSVLGRNSPETWKLKRSHLLNFGNRFEGVYIENSDAIEVIKRWDSPHTFFYCDPPYPETNQGHYGGYTVEQFQKLVNALEAAQGSFMLSNYDQPSISIPEDWERHEFKATMSASNHKDGIKNERTEVIWRRFNRVPVRDDIAKLYASGNYDCFKGSPSRQLTLF